MSEPEIKTTVDKQLSSTIIINGATAKTATVKANISDGNDLYIFDLYDESGGVIALNRYVVVDGAKQPFDSLTVDEKTTLQGAV